MVFDPEFSATGKDKSKPRIGWRCARWLLIYPMLGFAGCHTLLTGSPIPLWYTEHLEDAIPVKQVTEKSLVLADGRNVALPFIKRLPMSDPVFRKALKRGVEVGKDGEVIGLITVYPYCGNDPYRWYTKRINLSDLAGFMDPDAIDDRVVHPDEIQWLKENESRALESHGLPFDLMGRARHVRSIYRAARERAELKPGPTYTFTRDVFNPQD
jgi:hypothetical protein